MDPIRSDIVAIQGYGISMIGGRPENQDDWGYTDTPLGFLLVVCDGMGGGPGGATASSMVKREIAVALRECNSSTPPDKALRMAAVRAQEALEAKMEKEPALRGMGSTFVALLVSKQSAFVAHAGDSRCYLFRGKRCIYRSQDHSLVAELVRKKALTEEEARLSPQSNVIARGLGNVSNNVPDVEELPYKKGDRFAICTDGIWGVMPHKDLLPKLSAQGQLSAIAGNLSMEVDSIGFAGGGHHDNHTLAVIEILEDSIKKSPFLSFSSISSLGTQMNMRQMLYIALSVLALLAATIAVVLVIKGCGNSTPKAQHTTISTSSNALNRNLSLNSPTLNQPSIGDGGKEEGVAGNTDTQIDDTSKVERIKEQDGNNQLTTPLDSVYNHLEKMLNMKKKDKSKAVEELEHRLDSIRTILERLWEGRRSKGEESFLKTLRDKRLRKKTYEYYNKVQEVTQGKDTLFVPTDNAKRTIERIRKRIEYITAPK